MMYQIIKYFVSLFLEEVIGNFPERELEKLLHDFDYDTEGMMDFTAEIEESCEDMGIAMEETEMKIEVPQINEQVNTGVLDLMIPPIQNIPFSHISNKNTNKWSKYIPILKKNIFWKSVPYTPPTITIRHATNQLDSTKILYPIDYFGKYYSFNDFENMAKYTNLYASQKKIKKFVNTTTSEMKVMIVIHMLFGVLNFPRVRMY